MKLFQALLTLFVFAFLPLHAASLDDLTYTTTDGEVAITDCDTAATGELVIPNIIGGNPVTSIANFSFSFCSSLTSITIPNGVTSIGAEAFRYCRNLTSITIPDGVTSIWSRAFEDCTSLTSITIPDSVTSIGNYAFVNCTSLTDITIPDSITHIGADPFAGTPTVFTEVENINFLLGREGKRAYLIDGSQASGAIDLTTMVEGAEVSVISANAFVYCTSLTGITIPDSVASIGASTFYSCTSLTSITIGNGVTSIGQGAFFDCSSLTSITIPDSVTSIDEYAFQNCTGLTSITIPDGVTNIGEGAFGFCTSLTSITIGNGLTTIELNAFAGCTSLTSITIPDSVTSIRNGAFYNCISLTSVIFQGVAPTMNVGVFSGLPEEAQAYVSNEAADSFGGVGSTWEGLTVAIGYIINLNDGLVAYYPFNGNANDESGNGNDGVLKGTNPRFSDEAPSGNGLSLSSDSWVQIPHSPAINPKGSRTLSFTFSAEDEGRIFSNRRENGNRNWDMDYLSEEIRMTFFQNFSSGLAFTIPNQGANSFQHIVIVLDAEKGVVECYIDGALVDNVVFGGGLPESSLTGWENYQGVVPLDIGREEGYTDTIIESAVIDELRFYNRALSEEEVTALYNLENANPAPPLVQLGALYESPTGESITIDATPAAGFPAEFTYQWCFNGFKIPANLGGTGSSFSIDSIAGNEGTWSVTVTNETGSVEQSFEYRVYADTDSDGLSDAYEELVSLTDINNSDTDNDGLVDGDEVNTYSTNPNSPDSDSDGFTDLYELETAYNPNSAESVPDAQVDIMTAIEVDFNAALGATYEIQFSTDTIEWTVIEAGIVGEGNAVERLYSRKDFPTGFFRVERTDQ